MPGGRDSRNQTKAILGQKPHVLQEKFICELTPLEFRASCLGGYQMVIGLCNLPASLIVGLLLESFGMFAPLYFPSLPDPDLFLTSSFRHKTIELLLNLTNLLIKNYNLHQGEKPKKN